MSTNKVKVNGLRYDIVGGPSKDALFDACKYVYNKNAKISLEFIVAMGYTMPKDYPYGAYIPMKIRDFEIYGIEHEDGSGENLNLHGSCRADLNNYGGDATYMSYRFKAFYNTRNRKGHIIFVV